MRENLVKYLREEMKKAEESGNMDKYYELRTQLLKWT